MRKLLVSILVALTAIVPAMYLRLSGAHVDALAQAGLFGLAILAAGFLLSWGAEAAEGQVSAGLILAMVALVTVLPEYAVDLYYAFMAGRQPESNYVHYAAANMTGANRLLVGVAWPLLVLLNWWRTRTKGIVLGSVNRIEVGFLLLSSLYAVVILLKNRIDLIDSLVLFAIFFGYLRRVGQIPKVDANKEPEGVGPGAAIEQLPVAWQWALMAGLATVAAVVIFLSAEPFAEAMIASGRRLGIDEFLLIQWLAPLASEAPAVVIAVLFVVSGRAAGALTTMISDKINQWTLLVGMLPLAISVGAGRLSHLPLDARQHEEFFLTAAQSLFGLALLLRLRLEILAALALGGLFAVQVALAFLFRNDEARTIQVLTWMGWAYIFLASAMAIRHRKELVGLAKSFFGR
uniref:sodium:proton exchanger n=1 Tax=uncultured Acidovorax sp. TaxID=158751 RepID=UPI00076A2001|nr:sodium:proton exchanger [uncultured Acidovorax sp.]